MQILIGLKMLWGEIKEKWKATAKTIKNIWNKK